MHMHARLCSQKPQILFHLAIVLPAADPLGHLVVKSLNSHLKLKRPGRELPDQLSQSLRQPIRDQLKVQKQSRPISLEEKLQNPLPDFRFRLNVRSRSEEHTSE